MKAYIKHISYYLPERILTNEDLEALFPERSAKEIFEKTGIRKRHISADNEISSDMAVKAAQIFFDEHPDVSRDDIDFLIFSSQGPDFITPATSCLLQSRLGLNQHIGAYDMNLGCSGFIYALSQAKGLIESGQAKNVLLLISDAITKMIHPGNRSGRTLAGDAASAILVSSREEPGIGKFVFGTNGSNPEIMMMKSGGSRYPSNQHVAEEFKDEHGNVSSDAFIYMDGAEVLTFTVQVVPKMVHELQRLDAQPEDVDYYIFHQANLYMLETLRKILKIPSSKFCIDLSETGNTVASTIPIALKNALDTRKVKSGDKVMLVTFGVGLSWAATTIII